MTHLCTRSVHMHKLPAELLACTLCMQIVTWDALTHLLRLLLAHKRLCAHKLVAEEDAPVLDGEHGHLQTPHSRCASHL